MPCFSNMARLASARQAFGTLGRQFGSAVTKAATQIGAEKLARMNANKPTGDKLLERRLTGLIIGAFYPVYNELGFGFPESVYRRAMYYELSDRGVHVEEEFPSEVWCKQWKVGFYRSDLMVERRVIIEIKSSQKLSASDFRQPVNYLHSTRTNVAMLLHFGPKPRFYRYVCTTHGGENGNRLVHVKESNELPL